MYEYAAVAIRVVDGDTIHARVDLGFDLRADMTLRLAGINAPEMPTPAGLAAKTWLLERLNETGGKLVVRTEKDRKERYGRYLATLLVNSRDINAEMVTAGFAKPYDGHGPRP